jgi:hypothetical protein
MEGAMGPPGVSRGAIEATSLEMARGSADTAEQVWRAGGTAAGRTVDLRFRIAATGESNGGRWVEAASAQRSERPRFFLPGEAKLGRVGDEVALRARVGQIMSLDTGRRALVLEPLGP